MGWLNIKSVWVFIVVLYIGYGNIKWMMVGEMFEKKIKGFES